VQEVVYDRFHKQYHEYRDGEGNPIRSREHYAHCKYLRPRVPKVEEYIRKHGKIPTLEIAMELGI
jgi:hypothetical protein